MGVNVQCSSYDDMKLVVASLPSKAGNAYYRFASGAGFWMVVVTEDFQFAVGAVQNTLPASLATDFPNAVQLADSPIQVTGAASFVV